MVTSEEVGADECDPSQSGDIGERDDSSCDMGGDIEIFPTYAIIREELPEPAVRIDAFDDTDMFSSDKHMDVPLPQTLDEIVSDDLSPQEIKSSTTPSSIIMDHQRQMLASLHKPRIPNGKRCPKAMLVLNKFGVHMQFSDADGDLFLQCVHDILVLRGDQERTIFKRWKNLKKQCLGDFKLLVPITEKLIAIPAPFPTYEDSTQKKLLNATRCYFVSILIRLGDALLRVKNANFHTKFLSDKGIGTRQISSYPSGNTFKKYCAFVTKTYGDPFFPLMVGLYLDEGAISTTRSATPFVVFIMNVTGTCFVPIHLGFCPGKLAYSERELGEIITANGLTYTQGGLRYAYALAKRKTLDAYICAVVQPILDLQAGGCIVQVGHGADRQKHHVVPFVSHFCGDNAALQALAGVSSLSLKSNCRICTQTMTCDFTHKPCASRDPVFMTQLTSKLEVMESSRVLKKAKGSSHSGVEFPTRSLSADEEKLRAYGKLNGVMPGCMRVSSLYRNVPDRINNFYRALCVDLLHTLRKGLNEYCVSWILQIVIAISGSKLSSCFGPYKKCAATLNKFMSVFPKKHTLFPFKWVQFQKGVTCFMKSEAIKKKKAGAGVGMMTGGFPAWHFCPMLLQMLFCFCSANVDGVDTILPNIACIFTDHGVTYNPHAIIIGALASVLEVNFMCAAKALTTEDLKTFQQLIANANIKVVQLFDMKQALLRMLGILKTEKTCTGMEVPRNLKQHALTHLPNQFLLFGVHSRGWDTEIGEKHISTVKCIFKKTSMVPATTELEMTKVICQNEFSEDLLAVQLHSVDEWKRGRVVEHIDREDEVGHDEEILCFVRAPTKGATELLHGAFSPFLVHVVPNGHCPFIHPLLPLIDLHTQIVRLFRSTQEEWVRLKKTSEPFLSLWYHSFHKTSMFRKKPTVSLLHLCGAIKCKGQVDTDIDEFLIRACTACSRNRHNSAVSMSEHTFSFLEVKYKAEEGGKESTCFVKVLAIIVCTTVEGSVPTTKTATFLVVARLQPCVKVSNFPYSKFEFEIGGMGQLSLDTLPLDCIYRPAMMIPSNINELAIENNTNYKKRSWFCVPFRQCVKTVNIPYCEYSAKNTDGSNLFSTAEELESIMAQRQSMGDATIESTEIAAASAVDHYDVDFNWEGGEEDCEHDNGDQDWVEL